MKRSSHAAFAVRGELLVFGGEQECDETNGASVGDDLTCLAVRRYSPQERLWRSLNCVGAAPRGRIAPAATAVGAGERLFVFGGFDPANTRGVGAGSGSGGIGFTNATHVLDFRAQPPRWRAVAADDAPHAPSARRGASLCWWPGTGGGALLAFGGWDLLEVLADHRRFDLQTNEWAIIVDASEGGGGVAPQQPSPRRGHSATVVGDRVLLFGGCLGLSTYASDLWAYDGACWLSLAAEGAAPSERAWHTATALEHARTLLLVGGRDAEGCCDDGAWLLDVRTTRWASVRLTGEEGRVPRPRCSHSATLLSKELLVVYGGRDDTGELLGDVLHVDVEALLKQVAATA